MNTELDLSLVVNQFLPKLKHNTTLVSDPFIYPATVVGRSFGPLSVNLRGKLDVLYHAGEVINTKLIQDKAKLPMSLKQMYRSTRYPAELRTLNNAADIAHENARHDFYQGLTIDEKNEFDEFCLATAGVDLAALIPRSIPKSLRGPFARLAFEYSRVEREFVAKQAEVTKWQTTEGLQLDVSFRGIQFDDNMAKQRLVGRWFRELIVEQMGDSSSRKTSVIRVDVNDDTKSSIRMSATMVKICSLCRRRHFKGETIATKLALDYGYVRKLLGRLVKAGKLKNDTSKGYRTV